MSLVNINSAAIARIENSVQVVNDDRFVPNIIHVLDREWQKLVKLISDFSEAVEALDIIGRLDDPFDDHFLFEKAKDIVRDVVKAAENRFGGEAPLNIAVEPWQFEFCGTHFGHGDTPIFNKIFPGGTSMSDGEQLRQNLKQGFSWVQLWDRLEDEYGGRKGKDLAAAQIAEKLQDLLVAKGWSGTPGGWREDKNYKDKSFDDRFDAAFTERKNWFEFRFQPEIEKQLHEGLQISWNGGQQVLTLIKTLRGWLDNVEEETGLEADIDNIEDFLRVNFLENAQGHKAYVTGEEFYKGDKVQISVRASGATGIYFKVDKDIVEELKQYIWNWSPSVERMRKAWVEHGFDLETGRPVNA